MRTLDFHTEIKPRPHHSDPRGSPSVPASLCDKPAPHPGSGTSLTLGDSGATFLGSSQAFLGPKPRQLPGYFQAYARLELWLFSQILQAIGVYG